MHQNQSKVRSLIGSIGLCKKWEKPCFRNGTFVSWSHFKQPGGSNGVPGKDIGCLLKSLYVPLSEIKYFLNAMAAWLPHANIGRQPIPWCQEENPIAAKDLATAQRFPGHVRNPACNKNFTTRVNTLTCASKVWPSNTGKYYFFQFP